jgi:hypothetical protein
MTTRPSAWTSTTKGKRGHRWGKTIVRTNEWRVRTMQRAGMRATPAAAHPHAEWAWATAKPVWPGSGETCRPAWTTGLVWARGVHANESGPAQASTNKQVWVQCELGQYWEDNWGEIEDGWMKARSRLDGQPKVRARMDGQTKDHRYGDGGRRSTHSSSGSDGSRGSSPLPTPLLFYCYLVNISGSCCLAVCPHFTYYIVTLHFNNDNLYNFYN